MGTNYYAIKKADDETKAKIKLAIDRDDYITARDSIPELIHIGKSSGGWNFLFNNQNWRYFLGNRKSLNEFLSDCKIYDEYEHELSINEFWVMVDRKSSYKQEIEYGFIVDGLNFSNYTEFS